MIFLYIIPTGLLLLAAWMLSEFLKSKKRGLLCVSVGLLIGSFVLSMYVIPGIAFSTLSDPIPKTTLERIDFDTISGEKLLSLEFKKIEDNTDGISYFYQDKDNDYEIEVILDKKPNVSLPNSWYWEKHEDLQYRLMYENTFETSRASNFNSQHFYTLEINDHYGRCISLARDYDDTEKEHFSEMIAILENFLSQLES